MSVFDDMLKSGESVFLDEVALDYSYLPKMIPYRENEQHQIALAIKPLFSRRNGKNVMVYGTPGVGKTVAVRHVLKELEEQTDDIIPIYINCWQKNTSYKIALELCEILGYRFTHNKKTEDLLAVAVDIINKKSAVFCLDEVDKAEELDFLYTFLESVFRKSLILITNYKSWVVDLDERIRSRLTLEFQEFRKYNSHEIHGILKERLKYAFVSGVWETDAFELAAKRAYEAGDVRTGLYLLREAGNAAEDSASKKITQEHVSSAIAKLSEFNIKKSTDLSDDERFILDVVKENSGKKIGDMYMAFKAKGGDASYKTFQRKIEKLGRNSFIQLEKTAGGKEGNTTIISYAQRKLNEY